MISLIITCAGNGTRAGFFNNKLLQKIKQVKRGDLVRLQGELVEIKDQDLVWRSSLTPTDIGDGACEVFRVSSIQWIEKVHT